MAKAWHVKEDDGIVEIVLDLPGTEINVLNRDGILELNDLLKALSGRTDLRAVLFTSAKKRIFIAGADIKLIEGIRTKEDAFEKAEQGKTVFQLIEDLGVPTIAVINGPCLGGGYELALACTYRVASNSDRVMIGLPEVNLGILPGFGGSIRLPRLLGLQKSLPLILAGKMVSSKKAFKLGMVDQLFAPDELLEKSRAFARTVTRNGKHRSKQSSVQAFLEKILLGPLLIYPAARKSVLRASKGHYPAPLSTLDLIKRTYGTDPRRAFEAESRAFADLAVTEISKNLIKLFFLNERYKKIPWVEVSGSLPDVKRCGLIGAGVMGGGIAQLSSHKDIPIAVTDISEKALESANQEARRIYAGAIKRGRLTESARDQKMKLISFGGGDGLSQSDLIIEAVVEDLKIKKAVFKEWGEKTPKETVIASNTSSLPVTEMARETRFPERVVGLHFFNPVHRMPLVEVIRAEQTSNETVARTIQFARKLGKVVIVTKDAPGFLVNRLLLPYLNEAAFLLEEGMPIETIDKIAKKFGMPMGPVELVDQVGIDVGYKVAHILESAFGERMKVAGILETVKEMGLLGKKSGKGFYLYSNKKKTANPDVTSKVKRGSAVSEEDALKRLIYIMINEAARCLEEQVIDQASTVDIGMIMGTGFPPFRAGLLRHADAEGCQNIVSSLKRFQDQSQSPRFAPSRYLVDRASSGQSFYSAH
jgi:3-hydroxyacyl-CoA dehydrogenase / enoyl-CoA hydratase / 3-hydroxybutyryl-CoA epimerase